MVGAVAARCMVGAVAARCGSLYDLPTVVPTCMDCINGVRQRCQTTVPDNVAEQRCHTTVAISGAQQCCRTTVPDNGADQRCRTTVPNHGAEQQCQTTVPNSGSGLLRCGPYHTRGALVRLNSCSSCLCEVRPATGRGHACIPLTGLHAR